MKVKRRERENKERFSKERNREREWDEVKWEWRRGVEGMRIIKWDIGGVKDKEIK